MRRGLMISLILAGAALIWQPLWGQTPSVRKESDNKKKNIPADRPKRSTAEQRGTKESPLVVDTEGHQDTLAESEAKSREKEDKRNLDTWTLRWAGITAGTTVVLMLVGIGGVLYARKTLRAIEGQLSEIKNAGRQTDEMLKRVGEQADAAKRSIDVLVSSERAWVIVRPENTRLTPISPGAVPPYNIFRFNIINKG